MEQYIKRSPITGRKYDYFSKDIVRILNLSQIEFYVTTCDVMPLDIYISNDRKNPNKKIVVFVFSKEETQRAYDLWCKRKEMKEEFLKRNDEDDNE